MATYTWPPLSVTATAGPLQFTKDGSDVTVNQDTSVTANSRPLPVISLNPDGTTVTPATSANQVLEIAKLTSLDTKLPAQGQALAAASMPVVLTAVQLTTLTPPTTVTVQQGTGTNLHAVIDSSALPSGASTSALQTSGNSSLSSIDTKTPALVTGRVPVDGSGVTQPISASSLPLPTGASSETTLAALNTKTPALGTAVMASSRPVTIASDQTAIPVSQPDLLLTGQSAQTATVNNIIPVSASANATDVSGYRSGAIQVVSTGTAGTFIFEHSNDNVNFQTMTVYNTGVVTGTPIIAAVTASASQIIYSFPIRARYIRLRIATTITGGSLQAFTRISQESWSPAVVQVAQGTAANLNATVAGSLTTVSTVTTVSAVTAVASVTSSQTAIPGIIADVASAAITTTTTTAAFTPTFGSSYMVNIPVTAVSGTAPTLSVAIQESADSGTNWYTVYTFPTITATGSYNSPTLNLTGNRVRYAQTVTGTTPSFTRAVNRLQSSQQTNLVPSGTVYTDRSGSTSGTPSTSTTLAAANQSRRYFIIQNLSATATIYINFTSAASTTNSLALSPLGSYVMEASSITTEQINVLSTTASVPYVAKEG